MRIHVARQFTICTMFALAVGACASASPSANPSASPATSPSAVPSASPSTATSSTRPATPSASASEVPPAAEFVWKATSPKGDLIPNGIVRDPKGRLWVSDPYNDRFAIFTTDGVFVEFWGGRGGGDGQFRLTRRNGDGYGAIAFAPDGSFYVLDVGNYRVQKFDAKRQFAKAWGSLGSGPGQYQDPVGIAVGRDGRVHILDDVRGVVETYDANGKVLGSFSAFIGGVAKHNGANSLALDAAGDFYVSLADPNQVQRFDQNGRPTMTYGAPGSGPGVFHEQPQMMSVDAAGRLFVTQGPQRGDRPGVLVFGADGRYLTGWASPGSADGDMAWPSGILVDSKGDVYVSDRGTMPDAGQPSRIEKFHGPSFAP